MPLWQRVPCCTPLAVGPPYQRQGIGRQLITEGHAVAEGCDLSVLLGQPDYYPRFGYRIQTYGEEIAAAAVYLASDEAGFIHGATLALNGGRVSA